MRLSRRVEKNLESPALNLHQRCQLSVCKQKVTEKGGAKLFWLRQRLFLTPVCWARSK